MEEERKGETESCFPSSCVVIPSSDSFFERFGVYLGCFYYRVCGGDQGRSLDFRLGWTMGLILILDHPFLSLIAARRHIFTISSDNLSYNGHDDICFFTVPHDASHGLSSIGPFYPYSITGLSLILRVL